MGLNLVNRVFRPVLVAIGLAALLVSPLALGGAAAEQADSPLVVKIHADWCGTCTRMEPSWNSVRSSLDDRARFVVLDVTDADTVKASTAEADRLGIRSFFDGHKSKTGTVGVLTSGGKEVAVFKGELDEDAVSSAVDEARSA